MSRMLPAAIAVVALVATFSIAPRLAAQSPVDELRVARLVRDLGADSFAVRAQATDELGRLGGAARDEIERAARSDDPEVRLRAKDLLQAIKVDELWAPGRCRLPAVSIAASEAIRALCLQTGNHLVFGEPYGAFHDQPAQFQATTGDYWPLLDELCRKTGHHCRPHFDARVPGMAIVAGAPGKQPLAYAGPVRARITSARRTFNEEVSYEETRSDKTHTFQLLLEMAWEDHFKLVAYRSQPEMIEAVTDTGQRLASTHTTNVGWNVASSGARQVTTNVRCGPPPTSATELETLTLGWGVIAVGDMASLEVADLQSTAPRFQDDVELTVESFTPGRAGRFELVVAVRRDRNIPEPQEILFVEHELELLDARGEPLRKLVETSALADHGATFKATFAGDEAGVPKRLRFTYPRLRSGRNLEIVFRHVPLPTSRPE